MRIPLQPLNTGPDLSGLIYIGICLSSQPLLCGLGEGLWQCPLGNSVGDSWCWVCVGNFRILILLFANEVVLFVPSVSDLQHVLAGMRMRIYSSNSLAIVLYWTCVADPVGGVYSFMSDEMKGWFVPPAAILQVLHHSITEKRKLDKVLDLPVYCHLWPWALQMKEWDRVTS